MLADIRTWRMRAGDVIAEKLGSLTMADKVRLKGEAMLAEIAELREYCKELEGRVNGN